ncbi:MAG: HAD family hydrolase [Erysipelotrichaceae bacterium]|jgi:cation-transporting ATPase E|nr:HAD family hydrolase [Erysipelotrichaceae bacterium]
MAKTKQTTEFTFARVEPDITKGLSEAEVKERVAQGAVNVSKSQVGKSYGKIVFDNIFTFFNCVLFVIAAALLFFLIYLNAIGQGDVASKYIGISKFIFLVPVVMNIILGTIQECNGKRVLDKLKIVTEAKAEVIRDGQKVKIPSREVVLDDAIVLSAGEQASSDIIVKAGSCEVDESMLTGESDFVKKNPGDTIFSGSAIMVGSCTGVVTKVGDETYASTLSNKVKALANHKSQLMTDITNIIKVLSVILLIIVAVVFGTLCYKIAKYGQGGWEQGAITELAGLSFADPGTWGRIVVTCSAFAVGVIPTGLILITSVTLAVSIVKLSRKQTLIQELYSLENLSRVDTICLDKTGTLTDGTMTVIETKAFVKDDAVEKHIRALMGASTSINQTAQALIDRYGKDEAVEIKELIPFSSANKSSGIVYPNGDELRLGAPEYLLPKDDKRLEFCREKAAAGNRVLAMLLNGDLQAFFVLEDNIRTSAKETLEFFYENNVDVRIISGDNPLTVSKIAEICGVKNPDKYISLEGVPLEKIPEIVEDYVIFARVSPEQKQALVEALQSKGHKVAMTGDGVNDILALRKANASISFAKATDAAKSCADVVLLDNDFSHLQDVVGEGRRVVNNVQRSAILFLMKTVAVIFLAFALIPMKQGQFWYSVENVYLLEASVIGGAGFLLSLEMCREPIKGSFIHNVIWKAAASGILVLVAAIVPVMLNRVPQFFGGEALLTDGQTRGAITIMTELAGIIVVVVMCLPFTKWRVICMVATLIIASFLSMAFPSSYLAGATMQAGNMFKEFFQPWNSPAVRDVFGVSNSYVVWITFGVFFVVALPVYLILMKVVNKRLKKFEK